MSRLYRTPDGRLLLRSKNQVNRATIGGVTGFLAFAAVDKDGNVEWLPSADWNEFRECSDEAQAQFEEIPAVKALIEASRAARSVIVCSRGRRDRRKCAEPGCTTEHVALCDYPIAGGKTCDRPMCKRHRHPVPGAVDTDYCGPHHRQQKQEG